MTDLICKIDGCDQPAVSQYGPLGRLCDDHRTQRKLERNQQRNGDQPAPADPAVEPVPVRGRVDVFELATRVVKARGALEDAINDLADHLDEMRQHASLL